MTAQRETFLTAEGLAQLQQELEQLKSTRRQEVAERVLKASEAGGTVDNAEYEEAKNERAFIEGRVRELEAILFNAKVAPARKKKANKVEFGSSVTVVTGSGQKRNYTVVGSAETAPLEGKISVESPVGQALLGHKVGDEVDVETPAGITKLKISRLS